MNGWSKDSHLKYGSPTPKIFIVGVGALLAAFLVVGAESVVNNLYLLIGNKSPVDFCRIYVFFGIVGVLFFVVAFVEIVLRSDERRIYYLVRKRLCDSYYGNPLHLCENEVEPCISVISIKKGFRIRIECQSSKFDDVADLQTVVSDCLRSRFDNYAVVSKEEDIAGRYVDYFIQDVVKEYSKQAVYKSIDDIPLHPTRFYIRPDLFIDFSKVLNASTIIAGRTRSGKSTGGLSVFLIPTLKRGRDSYGSKVVIVDPKSAELSLCPHVLSPDINGNVEHILDAIRDFNKLRIRRQKIINARCRKTGKAHKWYKIGMHPSILFLDEFISLQDLFPKKPTKEKPEYCLAEFQGLLLQIATQGASAGCFLILSTAEASVGVGGLSTTINNACGIRILFKPSIDEARFLWDSNKLEVLHERQYSAGDAWFSADDGINNCVRFVKFPRLQFGEYEALSVLLDSYYSDNDECPASREARKRGRVPVPNKHKTQ